MATCPVIPPVDPSSLQPALRVLRAGGVVAYPTEAVFGLGCLPTCEAAVKRVRAMKRRPRDKGFIIVAANFEQLGRWVDPTGIDLDRVLATWPGPVTWVFPAIRNIPHWLRSPDSSVAVRVSAHPVVMALCAGAGPLISTSANPAGQAPARSAMRTRAYFGRELDCLVPGLIGGYSTPTTIRSARTGGVIRKGG